MRAAMVTAIFAGILGGWPLPGVAATTSARVGITVRVVRSAQVRIAPALARVEAGGAAPGEVVDASGTPMALRVHFADASAEPGAATLVVMADGAPPRSDAIAARDASD